MPGGQQMAVKAQQSASAAGKHGRSHSPRCSGEITVLLDGPLRIARPGQIILAFDHTSLCWRCLLEITSSPYFGMKRQESLVGSYEYCTDVEYVIHVEALLW